MIVFWELFVEWLATLDPASFWLGVGLTSFLWALITPRQGVTPPAYQWNPPERLPPVGCPLVLRLGAATVHAERISHLSDRGGEMDYRLSTGQVVRGRFPWSYP